MSVSFSTPRPKHGHRQVRWHQRVLGLKRGASWPTLVVVGFLGILALQTFYHHHLSAVSEYDDGVYFGASLALVHGSLPYVNFDFLQPPGIALWLAPMASLAHSIGPRSAMELARLYTDIVSVVNLVLVGAILAHRSPKQRALGMMIFATSIGVIQATQTILIEPFLILWCLVGVALVFQGDRPRSTWWAVPLSGVAFGIGGATKLWAIFPALATLIVLVRQREPHWWRFIWGAAAGFAIVVGPFVIESFGGFFHEVFVAQAQRGLSGETILHRLADLTGVAVLSQLLRTSITLGAIATLSVAGVGVYALWSTIKKTSRSPHRTLANWSALTTALVGLSLAAAPSYYYHYGAFLSPFLALWIATYPREDPKVSWLSSQLADHRAAVVTFAMALGVLLYVGDLFVAIHPPVGNAQISPALIDALKSQTCVITNTPSAQILAGQGFNNRLGCPSVVDWNGTERVLTNGISGEPQNNDNPLLQRAMISWFTSASAVLLGTVDAGIGSKAMNYLHLHFRATWYRDPGVTLYLRKASAKNAS